METMPMLAFPGGDAPTMPLEARSEVVEIALLLPTKRAEALVALSRRRRQSVGQILRQMIDNALDGDE